MWKFAQSTSWIEKGILLERAISCALESLGIENEPNHFDDRYSWGYGIDNKISTSRGSIKTEAKNLNGNYMVSPKWIEDEIINRFSLGAFIKILVISILNVSERSWALLRNHNIRVIELGFQVTPSSFKKAVALLLQKLYFIKVRYMKYIVKRESGKQTRKSNVVSKQVYNVVIDCVNIKDNLLVNVTSVNYSSIKTSYYLQTQRIK